MLKLFLFLDDMIFKKYKLLLTITIIIYLKVNVILLKAFSCNVLV